MNINRSQILKGLDPNIKIEVHSISPIGETSYLLIEGEVGGIEVRLPLNKKVVGLLLADPIPSLVESPPGQTVEKPRKPTPKVGPKVGTTSTKKGVTKKVTGYDFTSTRIRGRRKLVCPTSGRKGFPVWETV